MFFSHLSKLETQFSLTMLEKSDQYLASLTPTAATLITASKLSLAIGESYPTCFEFLKACVDIGFMIKNYALLCPECRTITRIVSSLNDLEIDNEYCHRCDEVICYDETNLADNVVVIFSIKDITFPFVNGQQLVQMSTEVELLATCPRGDLSEAIRLRVVGFDELFSYTDENHTKLLQLIAEIKQPKNTTTAVGATLEEFCTYLFNICPIFRATRKLRTKTNQIDTFVRITSALPDGLFGIKTNFFAIECKNESTPPKGEYLNKLHSILRAMSAELGIIVSKKAPPNTFPVLAHDMFLKDGMCFIWFDLDELEKMVNRKHNLLSLMDQKILGLKTNATRPLSELGLY